MSDGADPFARRDRTIIRPNPGGRLPQAPPPAPSAQGGAAPASRPVSSVNYPAPAPSEGDAWMVGRAVNPYQPENAAPPPMTPAPASPHV